MDEESLAIINELLDKHQGVFKRLAQAGLHVELYYYVMTHWRDYFSEEPFDGYLDLMDKNITEILIKDKAFVKYKNDEQLLSEIGIENAGNYILYRLRNKFIPTKYKM